MSIPQAKDEPAEVTRELAAFSQALAFDQLDGDVVTVAKQCVLDWLGVTIAAASEDVAVAVRRQVLEDAGAKQATLIPSGDKVAAAQAALVNGVAGHALDYDDVLRPLRGHPTAPVLPAVLALAERRGAGGADLLCAFVAGVEVAARVGALLGDSHYETGWHSTATAGCFGAAAGSARLLGLDAGQCAHALGLAGVQAAGLKAGFGSMAKPFQVGKAAANGLGAAQLAARGVTARPDILECRHGVGATQTEAFDAGAALEGLNATWHTPDVLFKYHAACYGTHAPIEAAMRLRRHAAFDPGAVERIVIEVHPRCLGNCNIRRPRNGLEGKFSLRFATALALLGEDTAAIGSYSDEMVCRPDVVGLIERGEVRGREAFDRNLAEVSVHLVDGVVLSETFDVGIAHRDLAAQGQKLVRKFRVLSAPVIGEEACERLVSAVENLDRLDRVSELTAIPAIPGTG